MFPRNTIYAVLTFCIAMIWLINGLWCKALGFVPRHQDIIAGILGHSHARVFTILIGISEIGMAFWIISGYKRKVNALLQMLIIGIMNTLEFFLVPDMLLWGRFNAVFALFLIAIIYVNEFYMNPLSLKK
jgi:uncharacterized membrane protein YphA (DoxX/SURF4 family)